MRFSQAQDVIQLQIGEHEDAQAGLRAPLARACIAVGIITLACDGSLRSPVLHFARSAGRIWRETMSEREAYTINIAGLERHLRLFEIKPGLRIAILNILGDTELVEACAARVGHVV